MARNFIWLFLIVAEIGAASTVLADEYTSSSFKVLDPVFREGAILSTSASYRLSGTIGELASALSTATAFRVNAGSGAYPEATEPTLTATAGAKQILLSWTASQGALGWTVSGYDVCIGTTSGTYTSCTDVGNVTNSARTNLTAGTAYFFRLRVKDAFGNVIVRSNEASATPTASSEVAVGPGGGGGGALASTATATLKGRAYPGVKIALLLNGAIVREAVALPDATFSGTILDLQPGTLSTFGVVAKDSAGRSSILLTYTINIPQTASAISIENIFIPPTIDLSATAVARGKMLDILGQAFPQSSVIIRIQSVYPIERAIQADANGAWFHSFNTFSLAEGLHTVRAKSKVGGEESSFGVVRTFTVGAAPELDEKACRGADVSGDGQVNLSDISILLTYWNAAKIANQCADVNGDGRVNLIDFSILLFFWTG